MKTDQLNGEIAFFHQWNACSNRIYSINTIKKEKKKAVPSRNHCGCVVFYYYMLNEKKNDE